MGGVNITFKILKLNHQLSEYEIDQIVVAQANDDEAWEEPVVVAKQPTLSIPAPLVGKARIAAKKAA